MRRAPYVDPRRAGPSLEITMLVPPYRTEEDEHAFDSRAQAAGLADGTLLLFELSEEPPSKVLGDAIGTVRRRWPTASIVLRLWSDDAAAAARTAVRGTRHGARAIVVKGDELLPALRPLLTDMSGLPKRTLDWLRVRGVRFSPRTGEALRTILEHQPTHATLGALLSAEGISARSLRDSFRRERLPSPRRWMQLARGTRTALALQANPTLPLLTAALRLGYADLSHLSSQLYRTFGVRASSIRGLLSDEWLMERWLAIHGRAGNEPSTTAAAADAPITSLLTRAPNTTVE